MPSFRAVRMIRQAISPRLAMRREAIIATILPGTRGGGPSGGSRWRGQARRSATRPCAIAVAPSGHRSPDPDRIDLRTKPGIDAAHRARLDRPESCAIAVKLDPPVASEHAKSIAGPADQCCRRNLTAVRLRATRATASSFGQAHLLAELPRRASSTGLSGARGRARPLHQPAARSPSPSRGGLLGGSRPHHRPGHPSVCRVQVRLSTRQRPSIRTRSKWSIPQCEKAPSRSNS